ncbi:hypothetical protein ACH4GP_36620 [Streptomyces celluloflavus]|uniref:Virginiamycin B lyase n=1 Tax=Streptomyces celluloflavus TaxID=58344 RepID=A0ABW7RP23_9ACTN
MPTPFTPHGLRRGRLPSSLQAGASAAALPGIITEFTLSTPGSSPYPWDVAAGPDGNLWFTEYDRGLVGQITPGGAITEYPLPTPDGGPTGITAGPDGNVWFTEYDSGMIGRITPDGAITDYRIPSPNSFPWGITAGPDGNLWFTEYNNGVIGQITADGSITEHPLTNTGSGPTGITAGPDGNLWFVESTGNQIGQIAPGREHHGTPHPQLEQLPVGHRGGAGRQPVVRRGRR